MAIETYMGKDYPVGIDGIAAERLQSFSFDRNRAATPEYQLGTEPAIGLSVQTEEYTAQLSWFPINANVEQLLVGEGGSLGGNTSLKSFVDASGVSIVGPKGGITTGKVTSISYRGRVQENLVANATIEGTGWGSTHAYVNPTPTGEAAYQAKDIVVTVNSVATARAQGFDLRGNIESIRVFELGNSDPADIVRHRPAVECSIDWAMSDNIAGDVELTQAAPGDIEIEVNSGSGALTLYATNMVRVSEGHVANVSGMATKNIRYQSKGQDTVYNNLIITET